MCNEVAHLMENTPAVFTGIILPSTSILKAQFKLCQLRKRESKKTPLRFQGTLLLHKVFGSCKDSQRCSVAHDLGLSHAYAHALQSTGSPTVLVSFPKGCQSSPVPFKSVLSCNMETKKALLAFQLCPGCSGHPQFERRGMLGRDISCKDCRRPR